MAITIPLPSLRTAVLALTVGFVAVGVWLVFDLQPPRQLRKAQMSLLSAVEDRDWKRVESRIASDYADSWHLDRSAAIASAREIFANFLVVGITGEVSHIEVDDSSGEISLRMRLTGSGNAIASAVIREVNETESPFQFRWRRKSWVPWSWELTEVVTPPELGHQRF